MGRIARFGLAFAASLALIGLHALAARQQAGEPPDDGAEQTRQVLEENWIKSLEEHGPSHASGGRHELGPALLGNPTRAAIALRVGLSWSYNNAGAFSEFFTLSHPIVRIGNTAAAVSILDLSDDSQIAVMQPGEIFSVTWQADPVDPTKGTFLVADPNDVVLGAYAGPVFFRPHSPENLFRVESIERANILGSGRIRPKYRGALEVARGRRTTAGRVNLVNVVELESYVPGVVVNESPAFFHIEALKAQASAARGYAVANLGRFSGLFGDPFDIVDSTSSQVYRGFTSEHVKGTQAAGETRGLVASYEGNIITAFYSSSFGGYSDNVESTLGGSARPYLRGHYDGFDPAPDFGDSSQFDFFWRTPQPQTFDACERVANRFARYRLDVTAASIRSRLPNRFTHVSGAAFSSTSSVLTGLTVTERTPSSGRVHAVRIAYTTALAPGLLEVRGWDRLRNVIGAPSASTPVLPGCTGSNISANMVMNSPTLVEPYPPGGFGGVIVWGGGWGHNVGLSQYGGHGRGRAGQGFIEILKAYYTGVDVGAFPIDIGRDPGSGPPTLRQEFWAPGATGTLVIRPDGLKGLRVHINATYDLSFTEADLATDVVMVDVSPFLAAGLNVIQYNPVGRRGSARVTVIVE